MVAIVTPNRSQNDKMKVDNTTAPMKVEPRQVSKNNNSNPTLCTKSPTVQTASRLGNRSKLYVDPHATNVDASSLEGIKKQKYLKSIISVLTQ